MSDELTSTDGASPEGVVIEKAPPPPPPITDDAVVKPVKKTAAKKAPVKKAAAKKTAVKKVAAPTGEAGSETPEDAKPAKKAPARKAVAKKTTAKKAGAEVGSGTEAGDEDSLSKKTPAMKTGVRKAASAQQVLFQAPETTVRPRRKKTAEPESEPTSDAAAAKGPVKKKAAASADVPEEESRPTVKNLDAAEATETLEPAATAETAEVGEPVEAEEEGDGGVKRRPRRRGGRRRRKPANASGESDAEDSADKQGGELSDPVDETSRNDQGGDDSEGAEEGGAAPSRRTRTRNRAPKNPEDEIASVNGSTRLEAKKQRRREGREAGRRRAPIVSEAEFLARREAVDRVMVIRQREQLTQIGVLEDKVLVEHYVSRESQASMIGNVYLGRVQNVLPSMEAAFVDIGKGRNAVLYAGEVNWSGLGHVEGEPRKIESVLSPGQTVLVQVTKDPVGQKGARLTSQVSIPGRFLVYVPDGTTSGISRKLPDTERNRLKGILKAIVPDTAGVIVRTAAEGASEEELTRDVERLTARWADIEVKVAAGKAPELLYGEPDLTLKVVRDLFTEDFSKLIVQGDEAWELVQQYVEHVAPDLAERLERFAPDDADATQDLFAAYRVDEQIAKGLDRKVWLPSGGSLVIDRTEAMTVVDVNTGKFTGSGGNLEETVTKNNLEAAEEIVRQLRLRDIGGIIVVDFIDMVLESNRDLVLRRLVECLGRDRTRHQVAEVTSLGLVQMTRKRIGTGLVEAFSEECSHCKGRGIIVHHEPVATAGAAMVSDDEPRGNRRRGNRRGRAEGTPQNQQEQSLPRADSPPSPAALAVSRPTIDSSESGERPEPLPMLNADPPTFVVEPPVSVVEPVLESGESPAESAVPVVVTSTRRRRTVTRPAGPPVLEPEESAAMPELVEADAEVEPGALPEPVEADETDQADETDVLDTNDEESEESEDGDHFVLHVPVKKRGARKR